MPPITSRAARQPAYTCAGCGWRSRVLRVRRGFANEGLWPLCHVVDVRPKFRTEDWAAYKDINPRFAAAMHAELGATDAPV